MKVYVITQGEYSDYHIATMFTNEEVANDFVKKMNSKMQGYSQDFSVEEHELLNKISDYKPENEYLEITYRSNSKEIKYINANNSHNEEFEGKDIYFYEEGFYIAIMRQPLTVKNVLGAEKIMMDWVSQIEYELKNTFNGDLKLFKKNYNSVPF